MRNLKKFLALVLAMVMAMSLMVTANAATKSSKFPNEEINPNLVEAVDVLAGLKVFQGQNVTGAADGDKVFAPKSEITRKEVAALIYRVFSADVGDTKTHLYKDYADFTDVNPESWYAGYVGLCANHGIIKGSNNGRFYPDYNITGYEVLAMILRVVGYDEEGEFTGSGWQTRVASKAALLHITDNLNTTNYAGTLNQPATREVVAELIFQTMVRVPQVTHNSLGYNDKDQLVNGKYNPTLGQEKFGLYVSGWTKDKWGNPYYSWNKGGVKSGDSNNYFYINTNEEGNTDRLYPVYGPSATSSHVIDIKPTPDMEFTNTIRECDVAHALEAKGFKDGSKTFNLYVNQNLVEDYRVEATDTVTRVGGQGRLTKVYYNVYSPFAGALYINGQYVNIVTMVDTFLAQVTRVTPRVLDHNGHVVQDAQADLVVYDRGEAMPNSVTRANNVNDMDGAGGENNGVTDADPINFINDDDYGTRCTNLTKGAYNSKHTMTNPYADYTYTVGQYILVQGRTDLSQGNDWSVDGVGTGTKTGLMHTGPQERKERAAFETNMLAADPASDIAPVDGLTSVDAKQTSVTWNNGTHNVGGETKNDQLTLFMDYAGSNLNTTFTWYFDQYGNLIGIGPKANTVNYGVITSLYSAFEQGSAATTGKAVAMAHVKYADGTEADIAISKFITTGGDGAAPTPVGRQNNSNKPGGAGLTDGTSNPYPVNPMMDRESVTVPGLNAVELTPVYDYNAGNGKVMTAETNGYTIRDGKPEFGGQLYVAPVAQINKDNDKQDDSHYGIIYFNMFKFITTEDGVVTAIEIAGNRPGTGVDNGNSLRYDGHYHFVNGSNDTYAGKLSKSQGSITTRQLQTGAAQGGNPVWLDRNVKIILNRNGTLTTYDGLDKLPSDITIKAGSEVDWVDVNGDLRADYVYLYGETTGTVTYGLFYYNGGNAVWNGTNGTLTGWLNGAENTTLTFTSEADFTAVRNSVDYYGHMFAVRMMDGVVDELMVTDSDKAVDGTDWSERLLMADGTAFTNKNGNFVDVDTDIVWGADGSTKEGLFKIGVLGGNPYDENTQVAYYVEGRTGMTGNVTYERNTDQVYGTVTVRNAADSANETYYIGANTKMFGIGMGATHGEAVLEYLNKSPRNDVTIVYDVTNNGILEIYVATDPNITPSNPGQSTSYGVSLGDLTMQLTATTLSFTNTTGVYLKNGVADGTGYNAATNQVRATFYAENNVGEWVSIGTYSKAGAGTNSVATTGVLTLDSITVTSLALNVTYRVTVEINLGHGWITVCENVPIGRAS